MIDEYTAQNKNRAVCFASLGQLRYLSALKYVDAVVGNSSSGIVEAPSFKIATINIGNRQTGRVRASSILDVDVNEDKIFNAIQRIYTSNLGDTKGYY